MTLLHHIHTLTHIIMHTHAHNRSEFNTLSPLMKPSGQ